MAKCAVRGCPNAPTGSLTVVVHGMEGKQDLRLCTPHRELVEGPPLQVSVSCDHTTT